METNHLLIIFTKNPIPGKCKTRLAKSIGDEPAAEIYKILLNHTALITKPLNVVKEVHYSEYIEQNDMFDESFIKLLQHGNDLGEKMEYAFAKAFQKGFQKVIIIGSDLIDLSTEDLIKAFNELKTYDYVLGPGEDGGYYLLGMKQHTPALFKNKNWGTDTVLRDTLIDLNDTHLALLDERNDIDTYEDLEEFKDYLFND